MMADRKVFHDSVVPIPVDSGPVAGGLMVQPAAAEHGTDVMTLHFSLALPSAKEADLEAKVAQGQTVPIDVLQRDYGAKQTDTDTLVTWLTAQGFSITHVSPDRTSVYASAPVAQIEKS